jgi:Flp pilus assembly pilin Flp
MQPEFLKLFYRLRRFVTQDDGQDLIEYALVVSMIAFGATASMHSLAGGLNSAFSKISSALATNIT